jgi:hypothetical protein
LGNNTQSYRDATGNIINYSSSANRKAYEKQLEVAIQKDEQLTNKIQTFNDSIISLETRIVEVQSNTELASELGPLKYLSNITGKSMDTIINYLLLVIIFVFDPLAIALVIAANFAFAQLRNKEILSDDDEIDIPEKDWDENWPDDNDQDLETASLEDLEKWEKDEEEPYQIYVSGSSPNSSEWEIIDDDKVHEQNVLSEYSKTIDNINHINDSNVDFINKKRLVDDEIDKIKQYEQMLKIKKSQNSNSDIITYN